MDGNIFQIRILNCKQLRIKSETFTSLSMLHNINVSNIENLILDVNAFAFRTTSNKIRLDFTNVSVPTTCRIQLN